MQKETQTSPETQVIEDRNNAPKNFTHHQSYLSEEGRRNQPRNGSPKKLKKKRAQEHIAEAELRREMGVLAPFAQRSEERNES